MTQRQLGNGSKAKLAYDPSDRLNQVINTSSANVTLSSYDYALDGIGNFSSAVEDGTRPINWGTDSLNQISSDFYFSSLTSESWMRMILAQWDSFTLADWDTLPLDSMTSIISGSNQVAYSPAGNRTQRTEQASSDTTTYAYSPTNRLTAAEDVTGRTTYTYDANGNVLTIEEPSGDLTTNTWDGENRLVQVEHPDSSITTYSYNADGLRVEEDHDGVVKRLVYDGNNVQLETDDVDDLLVDNTYVPGEYAKALSQRRDGDSSFYLADGTKNIRQLTDSSQAVTDEYEFDAWGNSLSSSGSTINAQQYKGQELAYRADPDAGPELQYALHFRQYDPHTARFTSRDPAEDDLNLYRYVKNNPVNEVDPSGLASALAGVSASATGLANNKSPLRLFPETTAFILEHPELAREFTEKHGIPMLRQLNSVLGSGWTVQLDDVWAWNNAYDDPTDQSIWIEEDMTVRDQAIQLKRLVLKIMSEGTTDPSLDGQLRAGDIMTWDGARNQHQGLIRGTAQAAKLIKDVTTDVLVESVTAGSGLFLTHGDDIYKILRAAEKGGDSRNAVRKGLKGASNAPKKLLGNIAEKFPGTLGKLWRGSWDDLTAEMRRVDPSFNGFNYDPSLGSAGLYDPKTKTIVFGRPLHKVEKGLLAEEVRHFLDDVEFGLNSPDAIFRAWLKDRGLSDIPSNWSNANIRESNKWHHRRVFTRMLKNVDQQDNAIMNRILEPNDLKSVLDAYSSSNVRGRLTLSQLIDLIDKGLVGPY